MSAADTSTGNFSLTSRARLYGREDANRIVAGPLGREMRAAKHMTNEVLSRLSGVPERRIEMLRSHTEETPVYLEDVLAIASVLGPRFLTGILSEIDMYAGEMGGTSPEKIGAEIIQLAARLTGEMA